MVDIGDAGWQTIQCAFSSPESALLLVSTKNRDLWPLASGDEDVQWAIQNRPQCLISQRRFFLVCLPARRLYHVTNVVQCIFTTHFIFCSGCAWEVGNPVMLHIGESAAVSCMTAIHGRLWCGLGCNAVIVNTTTLVVEVRLSFLSFLHC